MMDLMEAIVGENKMGFKLFAVAEIYVYFKT